MHIGNMVAMMAAWLDARSRGQRMLLRIEDIDTPRVLPDADRWIMDDLTWFGMDWDGEPVYQSQRLDVYEQALGLIAGGDWDVADGSVDGSVDGSADGSAGGLSVMFGDSDGDLAGVSADGPASGPAGGSAGYSGIGSAGVSVDGLAGASGNPAVAGNLTAAGDPTAAGNPATAGDPTAAGNPTATNAHGHIYPCFCSRADIRAASAPQEGDGFQIYPGTCRTLIRNNPREVSNRIANGQRHSLRIAMPEPGSPSRIVTFTDRVFGTQTFDLSREIGDSIIRRSDGLFSYQFVVTVDDLAMGVDSIVRGRDLLRSTALQAWIRRVLVESGFGGAVGAIGESGESATITPSAHAAITPSAITPEYAHIPLIDNAAGRRLAKRERSLDMGALRKRGVTAEQVAGYCAYLLALIPEPEPCTPSDLLREFTWEPLRRDHADRTLDPASPQCPNWLADAVG